MDWLALKDENKSPGDVEDGAGDHDEPDDIFVELIRLLEDA